MPQTLKRRFLWGWGYKELSLSLNSNFYNVCIYFGYYELEIVKV